MIRLLVLTNLLALSLFACAGGYSSCIKKAKDSTIVREQSLMIPVTGNKLLVYSKKSPNAKILKHDPFLSLYLIEDTQKFAYPFDINMRVQLGNAMVDENTSIEGKILKNQIGLDQLATFSEKMLVPSILSSSCCSLEGIVTNKGLIQREYLQRFLSSDASGYSDIGVRVKNENGFVIVRASNPYMKSNRLKKGDCIVEFDGIEIKAASVFMRKVLFSKLGSMHTIKIKRDSKLMDFKALSMKRFGGGAISDTFLEEKGIYFDKTLHIMKLSKHFKEYGLNFGDQLLQVNGVAVETDAQLLSYIDNFKDFSSLLFTRENFQFFVNIK